MEKLLRLIEVMYYGTKMRCCWYSGLVRRLDQR